MSNDPSFGDYNFDKIKSIILTPRDERKCPRCAEPLTSLRTRGLDPNLDDLLLICETCGWRVHVTAYDQPAPAYWIDYSASAE